MSGGSYDYASTAGDLDDVLRHREQLERLADRLAATDHPGAAQAAHRTRALLAAVAVWQDVIRDATAELQPAWHAVEWRDSNDWGDDQLAAALAAYAR